MTASIVPDQLIDITNLGLENGILFNAILVILLHHILIHYYF